MAYLARAIADGHASLVGAGKDQRIIYHAAGKTERLSDPEEQVRAEFWAELIYQYDYEPHRIGVEITIPDRKPTDHADLVVFRDDARTRPYAVIECKRDGITDAEFNQAVEQVVGNATWAKFRADYVMVVAGTTRRALDFTARYGALEREENIIADLPRRYGRPEEFKYHRGGPLDIAPVDRQELLSTLRKCHQSLWGGGRLSPPAAFGELSKVIFVKISDEKAKRRLGEPYQFQIKTYESARRLADRIHDLYELQQKRDPEVFAEPIRIPDETLRAIVSHLEGINLTATDLDTKGVAFETFMDGFFKGDFGQFFTPREIIRFAVRMLKPTSDDVILDPACGSGGFLLHALDEVRAEAREYWPEDSPEYVRLWQDFITKNLYGIEINEEIARIAKMNMILHGDGHTNIVGADALDRLDRLAERNPGLGEQAFDLVLTNPPFGAQVNIAERPYLSDYALGIQTLANGRSKPRRSQKTEILYIERIWQFLEPGTGRAAVVLPDGILTNASHQYVRDFLLDRFQVLAVVSLPQTAFMHYGASVKASVVFLRRRSESELPRDDELIFMAAPEQIGYDAVGRKCPNELDDVVASYQAFLANPKGFTT